MRRQARRGVPVGLVCMVACGCDDPAPSTPDAAVSANACPVRARPACPDGWVRHEAGGCGPAVVLCASGGGAATGACNGLDLATPRDDGFYLLADGAVGGAFTAAAEQAGRDAPADDYTPVTGISACPTGWTRAADDTCDPRLAATCAMGAVAIPGGQCTRTGAGECGDAAWPTLPPEAAGAQVVHVRADAPVDGADGSMEHPYASMIAALRTANAGAWIRVAGGTYAEPFTLTRSMHVVGVCAQRVELAAPESSGANVSVSGEGRDTVLDLRGITLRGGVRAATGAHVQLAGVRVVDARSNGVIATGAGSRVTATDLVVTRAPGLVGSGPNAVLVADGARGEIDRAWIAQSFGVGVLVDGAGSTLRLRDAAVSTGPAMETVSSAGVVATNGGALDLSRVVLSDLRGQAVVAAQSGTVTAEDLVVRRVASTSGNAGNGLVASGGATLRATRVLVDQATYAGARVSGAGSTLALREAIVRGGRPSARGAGGFGLSAELHGALTGAGVRVVDDNEAGVSADNGAQLDLDGLIVRGTRSVVPGYGYGITADHGAQVTVAHALIAQNHTVGVGVIHAESAVTLSDAVVRDTDSPVGARGFGLVADQSAAMTARRVRVLANHTDGVNAQHDATVTLEDAVVQGTLPTQSTGVSGVGLAAAHATLRASRTLVEGNTGTGVLASEHGEVELVGCVVRGTRPSDETPAEMQRAYGVVSITGASLRAAATTVDDNTRTGALVAGTGSTMTLTDCVVRDNRVDVAGYGGLGVVAQENATLDATRLVVAGNRQAGIFVQQFAHATLSDAIVSDTLAESRGMGVGVAVGGATLRATRLAIARSRGAGLATLAAEMVFPVTVDVDGLFVGDVVADVVRPEGIYATRRAAYGLFVDRYATVTVASASVDRSEWGYFQSEGTLSLQGAVITRQSVATAAVNGPLATPAADALSTCGNARDEVLRDIALTEVRIPPPRPF